MNISELSSKLVSALRRYRSLLILIKGSPDPDVIASSFALKAVCDHFGIKSHMVALIEISLQQNRALIDELHIPVHFQKPPLSHTGYEAYAVLDHQSAFHKDLAGKIPCAVHIDHHEKGGEETNADFQLLQTKAGSTSTIMALFIRELDLPLNGALRTQLSTALVLGIHTDTDAYRHAVELDYDALQYLTPFADNSIIERITDIPISETTVTLIARAQLNKEIYKDWLIAGIGFIDESERDSIAIVADFLLEREKVETVVVFALIARDRGRGMTLDASFRTKDAKLNLDSIIKEISSEGGARRFKGAFQVNLDYFAHGPDMKLLWELVRATTVHILRNKRDEIRFIELKGFYRKLRSRLDSLFGR